MAYLYTSNLDVFDRRDQLEIMLDTGDSAILVRGNAYDLTPGELARARHYITLTAISGPATAEPTSIRYMPMRGDPEEGQVPVWDETDATFRPGAGGSGGGSASSIAFSPTGSISATNVQAAIAEVAAEAGAGGGSGFGSVAAQSPNGNWWEVTVDDDGLIATTDLGTSAPNNFVSIVLGDDGHYWELTATNLGELITTDIGLAETGGPPYATVAELPVNPTKYLAYTDPVQKAFDVAAVSGGEVSLPNGTWTRSTTLNWAENVKLRGEGPAAIIHYTGSGVAVQFGSGGLDVSTWTRLSARDVKLTGTSSATAGLKVRGATRFDVDNLTINGFTAGSGILLNGASFIGKIGGGRITNCLVGINCQKQVGDGSDGRGQAGNALEICGQMEIQDCVDGILLGDPTTNETLPVVAMSVHIHDITVESCTRGIWNVSGYSVKTSKIYYELNDEFDERIGSAGGNTIVPINHVAEDNFHNLAGTPLAYDIVRGDNCEIERPLIIGLTITSVTGEADNDTLTKTSHGLLDGTPVAFTSLSGGTGLATATVYYVRDKTVNTFKLAATLGGAAIDFTTDITAATVTAGRAWQTTTTAVHTSIRRPRYSQLATTSPYVDSSTTTFIQAYDQRPTVERIGGWLADDVQGAINLGPGKLPPNSLVLRAGIVVTEAFNSDGTDMIKIGGSGNVNRYAGDTDVSTTGSKTPAAGSSATPPAVSAGGDVVTATYSNGGSEPTTGKAYVWLEYIVTPTAPA
jgi:hypothetical protein